MKTFDKNKKYIFSKAKWLMDTGNVLLYCYNQAIRELIDTIDGMEIIVTQPDNQGFTGCISITPEHCDEANPQIKIVHASRVKDYEDELLERRYEIKNKLENLKLINSQMQEEIEENEQTIFFLESELENIEEELSDLKRQEHQAEDYDWRKMKL